MKRLIFWCIPLMGLLTGCDQPSGSAGNNASAEGGAQAAVYKFKDNAAGLSEYWYEGKAEINRYELQQNRYQGVHPGEAIAIFVTEDFLTDEQVKNDTYSNPNSTPVLKTNLLRKFPTGIYDYSIMTSVFTPTEVQQIPQTLKVTTTAQDWCGHAFMQLNFREQQYEMQLNSYFEKEGDQEEAVNYAVLEDELFNRIRIDPKGLPTGQVEIIPSTAIIRMKHLPFRAYRAEAQLADYEGSTFTGDQLMAYTLTYPELDRELKIVFKYEPPYIIEGWEDTYPSAFDQQPRTTVAKRTHTIKSAYWEQNRPEQIDLRQKLGMEVFPGAEQVKADNR